LYTESVVPVHVVIWQHQSQQ